MGDSSACLMQVQPFCYASGLSNEANEGNPIDALGQSVSFGRFMTEPLAWDKWSSFPHNRYVEEAERFSRPGSVAQKKAFFEAHYKKLAAQKAAALLEQANNAAQNNQHHEAPVHDNHNSKELSPISKLDDEENAMVLKIDEPDTTLRGNSYNSKFQSQLEGVRDPKNLGGKISITPPPPPPRPRMNTPELKQGSNSELEVPKSTGNNKLPVSTFKLLEVIGTSKFTSTPIKSTAPAFPNEDKITDSMSNMPALSSGDHKKRSTAKSLNFTPIREINKLTASVMKKFDKARVGASSSRASTTPAKASKDELLDHSTLPQLTEKKRNKMTTPTVSSPFSLRTEETAATFGKKKLEEMFNDKEAQHVQQRTKLKDKAKKRIRKLRYSFCFKARPLQESCNEIEASKREIEKDQLTETETPKQGRRTHPSIEKSQTSFKGPPMDNSGIKNFLGKNGYTLTLPLTSNSTMFATYENTSQNIQHGK